MKYLFVLIIIFLLPLAALADSASSASSASASASASSNSGSSSASASADVSTPSASSSVLVQDNSTESETVFYRTMPANQQYPVVATKAVPSTSSKTASGENPAVAQEAKATLDKIAAEITQISNGIFTGIGIKEGKRKSSSRKKI